MAIFITQGRYTREAVKGMVVRPEDRADAVARLLSRVGGKLIGYYVTFGEYDFMIIVDVPGETHMAAVSLALSASGGISDVKTTLALTSVEAKGAFAAASDLTGSFRAPGGV
jgi:uncharacterized protein with GYD domain